MSSKITSAEAIDMVKEYLANPNGLEVPDASGVPVKLKGLTISRANIESILNNSGENITDIFLALAVRKQDIGQPEQYFTLVAMGKDDNGNLHVDQAYDDMQPCPTSCALNYGSLFE